VIYICIPSHDEAPTIGLLLWKIRRVMDDFPRDYELLVLDDASTDGTQDVLAPYSRVLPLTILRNAERAGYAGSVERLVREAVTRASHPRRDMVVVLQADFSEAPEDIPTLVKRVEGGADLVGVSVVNRTEVQTRSLRWARRAFPWLLRRAGIPEGIADPMSGFRAYRVSILKRAITDRADAPLLTSDGWASNVELLLTAAPYARRSESTEVASRYDRRQRPTRFRAWNTLVRLWEVTRRTRRPAAPAEESEAAA
jgi:glycosyltransferase involved in cell wall biosynthesis